MFKTIPINVTLKYIYVYGICVIVLAYSTNCDFEKNPDLIYI